MHNQWLDDITSRIVEPPKWWLNGIPRYCDYHPERYYCPPTQALVRINCLGCYQSFDVAWGFGESTQINLPNDKLASAMDEYIDNPPQHLDRRDGFSCAGNSSGVEIVEILEVWQRIDYKWLRMLDIEDAINRDTLLY